MNSYEIDFRKGGAVVNEYLPKPHQRREIELNRMNVKYILAKVFGKMVFKLDISRCFVYIDVELSVRK